ncbi:MAG: VOC family protein [Cyanobacteria bacterium J06659_2]
MTPTLRPFHLAFPVADLAATRQFYTTILGCTVGREAKTWIDFNFFGHQLTAHLSLEAQSIAGTNWVDQHQVPVRHCGVVLTMADWQTLAKRLQQCNIEFIIEPHIRFQGQVGEQATLFFLDPCGNALEFKAFADDAALFAVSPPAPAATADPITGSTQA